MKPGITPSVFGFDLTINKNWSFYSIFKYLFQTFNTNFYTIFENSEKKIIHFYINFVILGNNILVKFN